MKDSKIVPKLPTALATGLLSWLCFLQWAAAAMQHRSSGTKQQSFNPTIIIQT
jgi:hypothetical protein